MDIFNVQALIKEGRLVGASDIDPTASYLQVGVFQTGNRRAGAGNPDTYPSYAIPISEISGKSNKNMIVVDATYGDDTTAVAAGNYDFNKPFQSIDAAILNAQQGDTLWLMPLGSYNVTENLLDKNLTIYAWSCELIFQGPQTGSDYPTLTIKGNADVYIDTNGGFNTTPCQYANIDIECNIFHALDNVPFYLDHLDYNEACYFTLKANSLQISGMFFAFIALNYNVNVDVVTFYRKNYFSPPPFAMGDFWFTNLGAGTSTGYGTTSRFNFGSTEIGSINGYSVIKLDFGGIANKYFVTGNFIAKNYTPQPFTVTSPTAIVYQDTAGSYVEIDATMALTIVSCYVAVNGAPKAIIKGDITHSNNNDTADLASCFYIKDGRLKLYADTRGRGKQILVVPSTSTSSPEIDISNCKLVNAGGLNNIILSLNTGCRVRLFNTKFIVDLANTFSAIASAALPTEIYSLYNNVAVDATITNSLGGATPTASIGEITNINMTDIGF